MFGVNQPQQPQQNPNFSLVMEMIKGKDPKEVFYEECKKRNVDPETILKQIK